MDTAAGGTAAPLAAVLQVCRAHDASELLSQVSIGRLCEGLKQDFSVIVFFFLHFLYLKRTYHAET